MIDVLLPIVAILLLVGINGVFVAAEFALVGARRSRFQVMAQEGNGAATWLLRVFDRTAGKDSYIAVAQLGITLASIGLGMYGEPAVAKWLYGPLESLGLSYGQSHALGFAIALGGITFLHVVFGEMIPKAMALQSPEGVSISLNPLMRLFGVLFRPMVILLNKAAFGLMRLLG
ncbi:MAG: CNNM domain-containing protein, partial [Brevundimonas sp.]|nr:CNNM domain-containing protein [Brevundimonas sp.]